MIVYNLFMVDKFRDLLRQKHIDRVNELGFVISQAEYAEWLGIDRVVFNRHYNGRRTPKADDPILHVYAAKLGPEVYDLVGAARPDKNIRELQARYDTAVAAGAPVGELMDVIDEWLIEQGIERID